MAVFYKRQTPPESKRLLQADPALLLKAIDGIGVVYGDY
jgi:hypothetical protein